MCYHFIVTKINLEEKLMNKKHPNGYWVKQLTDENIEELLRKLLTTSTKKFKRIINLDRTNDAIAIKCCSTRTQSYISPMLRAT